MVDNMIITYKNNWLMKKSNFLYAAMATVALTACSGEDIYLVQGPGQNPDKTDSIPISFSSDANGVTRADLVGADAAEKLGGRFVVFGYKGSETRTPGNTVYDNYNVLYTENTAYTTESNVANWEYVGVTPNAHATAHGITRQTIKYWDYSANQYDFIAWSTGKSEAVYTLGDLLDGRVYVSAIEYDNGGVPTYQMTGKAKDLAESYIADIVTIKKGQNPGYATETADYPDRVPIVFRSLGTKVRIGIYETVPGYSVKNVKFYTTGELLTNPADQIVDTPTLFSAGADIYTEGAYTVSFPNVDDATNADNNRAHVAFTSNGAVQAKTVGFGNLNYTLPESGEKDSGYRYLGRSANAPSFAGDAADDYYTLYLPNENGANLNLRVDFTLESIDGSGEVINVKNAKAQVPSIYTKWQPGFAYTYLFKISDKTDGRTGNYDPTLPDDEDYNSDPAGLYPITFDAVVVNAEDGDNVQETITTISTPSITTYQKGSAVVDNDEYKASTGKIFVTANENDALVTFTNENTPVNGDVALYTLAPGHTEAEVVDALSVQDDDAAANTIKGRSGLVLTPADFTLTNKVEYGVDGNVINAGANQVVSFTPAAGTYAFVYTKTVPTTNTDKYEVKKIPAGNSVKGYYRFALTAAPAGDAQRGVKYYNGNGDAAELQTVFIGQGVGNLYLNNEGTIATGYAVTGTQYYYTLDKGLTYKEAYAVAYEDFETAELYTLEEVGYTYTQKTETKPVTGTAYYHKNADNSYTYCVIYPQKTDGLYVIDGDNKVACADDATAVNGTTYFDKFTQNNGVYYVKVIKVQ